MRATSDAQEFIKQWWDGGDLEILESDPIKFVREIANPWLREQRMKGKDFPLLRLEVDENNRPIAGIHLS